MGTWIRRLRSQRSGIASSILLVTLLIAVGIVFSSAGVMGAMSQDSALSRKAGDTYAAIALAEIGARRAMSILQAVPSWGTTGDPKVLEKTMQVGDLTGSYCVTVTPTETLVDGHTVIEINSVATVNSVTRAVRATVHVEPAVFFDAPLSLYQAYDRQGHLQVTGDVYVTGDFIATGNTNISGDLIANSISLRGKDKNVGGSQITPITEGQFRDRPTNPAAWYPWAQRILWTDLYGLPVPDASGMTFEQMKAAAADTATYPYGVMYYINGPWTLEDSHPAGLGWDMSGRLTVVTTGKLTIEGNSVQYDASCYDGGENSCHLAFVSLGGVDYPSASNGPYDMFVYTYDGAGGTPAHAGQIFTQSTIELNGILAGGYVDEDRRNSGLWQITGDTDRLTTSGAPGLPGTTVIQHQWEMLDDSSLAMCSL